MRESLERQARLIAGLSCGLKKLIDAVMHMREQEIGGDAQRRRVPPASTPIQTSDMPVEEEQRAPQREQQSRLSDIGLQHQHARAPARSEET